MLGRAISWLIKPGCSHHWETIKILSRTGSSLMSMGHHWIEYHMRCAKCGEIKVNKS